MGAEHFSLTLGLQHIAPYHKFILNASLDERTPSPGNCRYLIQGSSVYVPDRTPTQIRIGAYRGKGLCTPSEAQVLAVVNHCMLSRFMALPICR